MNNPNELPENYDRDVVLSILADALCRPFTTTKRNFNYGKHRAD